MSNSQFQQLRQQLLTRMVAGEITREQYDDLVAEVTKHESTAAAETSSEPAAQEPDRYQSVGDLPTGQRAAQNVQPGLRLDNYQLEKRLGRGGMGEVWKARDVVGERDVVIKLLPPELTRSPDEMRRVKESFQRVHDLNHQNICPTHGLGHNEDVGFFLVMKFLSGGTLAWYRRAFIKKFNQFPLKEVARVLKPVARALDYSHQQKVVHRDIKPDNVMISRDGKQIHVVDFGLAAEIRSSMVRVSQVQMDKSGTYPYMAPEQWKGQLQDARTDQYALAVVAYELLTGRLPFEAPDNFVLQQCVLNQPASPIDDQPDHVNSAIARALGKEREERFKTCQVFITALAAASSFSQPSRKKRQDSSPGTIHSPLDSARGKSGRGSGSLNSGIIPPGVLLNEIAKTVKKDPKDVTPDDYERVEALNFDCNSLLDSLKNFELLVNLKKLDLRQQRKLSDLTPLSQLPLKDLKLHGIELQGFSTLAARSTLKKLTIYGTFRKSVLDVNYLRSLNDLRTLNIYWQDGQIGNIPSLGDLTSLASLDLYCESVNDLSWISKCRKLQRLDLKGCSIKNVASLCKLSHLHLLGLNETMVSDLSPLEACRELKYLYIELTPVTNISPLLNLPKLTCVHLKGTRISITDKQRIEAHCKRNG